LHRFVPVRRPHPSLRGGGDPASDRRSRRRRLHRARIARRSTARCRYRYTRSSLRRIRSRDDGPA